MSKAGPSKKTEPVARSKLVIRRLPPALPEAIFWTAVEPWVNDQTCLWKRYVRGKPGDGRDQRPVFSRAYVLMSSPESLVAFHRGFDGHLFRSKTGEEFQAVVEFAPVQKTPFKAKAKVDTRQGTIDDDPDYKSFLDSLSAPPTNQALEPTLPTAPPSSTPLLDHLRAQAKNKSKNAKKAKAPAPSAKDAALASVNKAASKRAPSAQGTAVMVAGKGRDVKLGPTSASETGDGAKGGKKKGKNKAKKETEQAVPGETPKIIAKPLPKPPAPLPKPEVKAADGSTRDGLPDRGRGGGPGRGRGRGRPPGPDGPGRSARGAVMDILTKNAEGGGKRGGRGRGQGAKDTKKEGGEGTQAALASQARIDA